MVAEAEENNLDYKVQNSRWRRWDTCSLCEQNYHGVVMSALGWACWKTYVSRPETDQLRRLALGTLGNGLFVVGHHEDALSVMEATLDIERRLGAKLESVLIMQGNIASCYQALRRDEQALSMRRDLYAANSKLQGEEHEDTVAAALNYANCLLRLKRFREAKALLHETMPTARRVLGEGHYYTLTMQEVYAQAICKDASATLDDVRKAVTTLAEAAPHARRVFGNAHPTAVAIERSLRISQAVLRGREALGPGADPETVLETLQFIAL